MVWFGKTHIIILWTIAFAFAVYMEIILINSYFKTKEYEETHFPCTHISGTCTKKPTYENCKHINVPDSECERRINGRT